LSRGFVYIFLGETCFHISDFWPSQNHNKKHQHFIGKKMGMQIVFGNLSA